MEKGRRERERIWNMYNEEKERWKDKKEIKNEKEGGRWREKEKQNKKEKNRK